MGEQNSTDRLEVEDQAGFFAIFKASHLSLPSHSGHTLESCPVCKIWFIQDKNLTGRPVESYRMVFIDFSK